MICSRCDKGEMSVVRTFDAGCAKTQERKCSHCKRRATYVLFEHPEKESAYMLAKKIREEANA